jgi:hypothetical protein
MSFAAAVEMDLLDTYEPVRTIEDALERLEAFIPRGEGWTGIHPVASGGILVRPDRPPPVLCETREIAIELWFQSAKRVLVNTHAKSWFLPRKPVVDIWQVTMTTPKGDHRMAADRFSVIAHIGVTW